MKLPPFFRALVLLVVASHTASAGTLEVTNNNNSGVGSLRQQIANALSDDGIVFHTSVTGRIVLASPLVISNKSLTITGPGANRLSLDGNGVTRVLIVFQTNTPVQISGLTFTNGIAPPNGYGAGISNMGALFLSGCSIVGNKGPVGSYTGGGIYNGLNAVLGMTGCTVTDNQAAIGAGIYNSEAAAIGLTNCTIAGNETLGNGGGISCNGDLIAIHCTITRNTSYTGSGGAAGLHMLSGHIYLGNCIIAGNFRTNSIRPDASGAGSTYTSWHYNFIGVTNGVDWSSGDATDHFGSETVPIDPQLGPLQDNGGPTLTMAPLIGSPVIDQGNNSGSVTDQRGQSRPFTNLSLSVPIGGDHSDIGAVEISSADALVTNTNNAGNGSLRNAIQIAPPNVAITFAANVAGTIGLTTGELLIGKSLSIQGPAAAGVTVSGNNTNRVFHVTGSSTVNISSLTIANGNTAAQGAGIYNDFGCTLGLSNCTVAANISNGNNGGGVANNGSFTAYHCTFSGNQAFYTGGGIYTYAGPVVLRNCTVVSNTAVTSHGGGLCNYSLVAGTSNYLSSTLVAGNSAAAGHADVIGVFTSGGYNLIGRIDYSTPGSGPVASVPTSGLTNGVNHDLAGSLASPTNAMTGPLQNNGGPTFTHGLKAGNPAIDNGRSPGQTTDQRGAPRPFDFTAVANAAGGDGSDIGAFESGSPQLTIQQAGSAAVLSWPSYYGDFTVQSVTNVILSNAWTAVAGTPVVSGNQYVLTNGPIAGNKFYRLKGN